MRNIIKVYTRITTVLILIIFINGTSNAQPNPGPGNQGSNIATTTDGPTVPFDGGMSLILISSGIGYGVKKLKSRNK